MTTYEIPLDTIPAQEFPIVLNEQNCFIKIYMRGKYLYFDLSKDNTSITNGTICLNEMNLIPYGYMDFIGNLYFMDTSGNKDPEYSELGTRYKLIYDEEA